MEVAYRNLALRCDGSERLVLVKAECGICKHIWDIQALDAVVCDLIHGETLQVQSNAYGLHCQGSQGARYETTLRVSLIVVRSWGKG